MRQAYVMWMSIIFTLVFSPLSYAWNALGHKVIANIAYEHLKPDVRLKVDSIVYNMHKQYSRIESFTDLACWADSIRSQKIESYTHWHYIDVAITLDGSPLKNLIDTDNGVWAVNVIAPVVANNKANWYERARFLAFYAHIISDLHQPLHTVTLIAHDLPDGDNGGNRYFVTYQKKKQNLHSIWDAGVGLFSGANTNERAAEIATQIMKQYPEDYFQNKVNTLQAEDWAKEGINNSKSYVYTIPYKSTISEKYIEQGQRLSQQQAALAGYRLARLLNQLLG